MLFFVSFFLVLLCRIYLCFFYKKTHTHHGNRKKKITTKKILELNTKYISKKKQGLEDENDESKSRLKFILKLNLVCCIINLLTSNSVIIIWSLLSHIFKSMLQSVCMCLMCCFVF